MKLVVVVEVVVVLVVVEGAGKTCGVAMFDGDAEKENSARVFLQFPGHEVSRATLSRPSQSVICRCNAETES